MSCITERCEIGKLVYFLVSFSAVTVTFKVIVKHDDPT